jgi:hypothetical protein
MDAFEHRIAGMLRRLRGRTAGASERTDCPNEEKLSLFLNGALAADARDELESHLVTCAYCAEEVVSGYRAADTDSAAQAPEPLVRRARGLVPQKEALFDLAVRLVRGTIELINTSGRIVPLPSQVLRGEPRPVEANALQVEQKVGLFKIAVEIDVSKADACQLIANVAEENGSPAEGVRLTLSSQNREQASFLTRAGVVVFDRIAPGEYSIAVSESDNVVGKIRLNLMLER